MKLTTPQSLLLMQNISLIINCFYNNFGMKLDDFVDPSAKINTSPAPFILYSLNKKKECFCLIGERSSSSSVVSQDHSAVPFAFGNLVNLLPLANFYDCTSHIVGDTFDTEIWCIPAADEAALDSISDQVLVAENYNLFQVNTKRFIMSLIKASLNPLPPVSLVDETYLISQYNLLDKIWVAPDHSVGEPERQLCLLIKLIIEYSESVDICKRAGIKLPSA